jgi:hypothetical protein
MIWNSTKYNEVNIISTLRGMAQTDFRLKVTRSRDDHEFYTVALPKYDPQRIADLLLELPLPQRIRPHHPIARLLLNTNTEGQQEPQEQLLSINYAGTVESLGEGFEEVERGGRRVFGLRAGQKKGSVQLLCFRECDHSPRDERFLQGNSGESLRKGYSEVAVCDFCQMPLWKYYDKEEVAVTVGDLCRANSLDAGQVG